MDDYISRQAAIKALTALEEPAPTARHLIAIYDCEDAIKALPSAQPEWKSGRWIEDGKGLYMCSSCGKLWMHWWARVVPPNQMCKELRYCPSCGADMRGE